MLPKNKRLTVRLDDVLDSTIERACENGKCDKTTVVINALRKALGLSEAGADYQIVKGAIRTVSGTTENLTIPKAGISEVHFDSGCIERYDKDGKLKMHLRPDPDSKGMYLDLQNNRWYRNSSGRWVGIVRIVRQPQ